MPRITALHMLRSTIRTVSAPASSSFRGSITHPTQSLCTLRVRRHRRLTRHSLPGGLPGLTWAGLAPADRASFAGAFHYSITSSASGRRLSEILTPSAFAVLRLMTNTNLVTCWAGRQIRAFQDADDKVAGLPTRPRQASAVAHQPAGFRKFPPFIDGGKMELCSRSNDQCALAVEVWISPDEKRPSSHSRACREGLSDVTLVADTFEKSPSSARFLICSHKAAPRPVLGARSSPSVRSQVCDQGALARDFRTSPWGN
jgi:hypothetical protein